MPYLPLVAIMLLVMICTLLITRKTKSKKQAWNIIAIIFFVFVALYAIIILI